MAYDLTRAGKAMVINECEYACAEEVKFTPFTSCIGILAKKKGEKKVIGIHLVLIDKDDHPFDRAAAGKVMDVLRAEGYDDKDVWLIGSLDTWASDPRSKDGYAELVAQLKPTEEHTWGDGTYGGVIDGDKVEVTY